MKKLFFKIFEINLTHILLLVFIFIFCLIIYRPKYILEVDILDNYIKNLGFEIKKIEILGNNRIGNAKILDSIKFLECENIFCLDLKSSKNALEENNWIKSAKLKLHLPSSLIIEVEEETPKFVLKSEQSFILLNQYGSKIIKLEFINKDLEKLIVLSGKGVESKVTDLLSIFAVYPEISKYIKEAELVSHRRWSLKHTSDIIIDLPEEDPEIAFFKIGQLQSKYGFLSNKIKKVDLRIENRMIIKLKERIIKESKI